MADAPRLTAGCTSNANTWKSVVPVICEFFGIVIRMFFRESDRHHLPHLHAQYGDYKASFAIQDGILLAGMLPPRQTRLVQTWIALRREELMADWILVTNGATLKPIEPLKQ